MRNVLETLPRDLVFELDARAGRAGDRRRQPPGAPDRPRVRRAEPVGDRSTVLVFVPRQRFHARLPEQVAELVGEQYGSIATEIDSFLGSSNLARITFTVTRTEGAEPNLDHVSALVDDLTTSWNDRLQACAVNQLGETAARRVLTRIGDDVPESYRSGVLPADAVGDMSAPARADRLRRRHAHGPDPPRRRPRATGACGSTGGAIRSPSPNCSRCSATSGCERSRNGPTSRSTGELLHLRHRRARAARRRDRRPPPRQCARHVRGLAGRRHRARRLQPSRAVRRPHRGAGQRAALLCEVHEPDRLHVQPALHRGDVGAACISRCCSSSCSRRASTRRSARATGSPRSRWRTPRCSPRSTPCRRSTRTASGACSCR